MPQFAFTVKDKEGKKSSGTLDAENQDAALKALAERDLVVTKITPIKTKRGAIKITDEERLLFIQELASMLRAGIPMKRALEVLASDVESKELRQIALELSSGLSSGGSLSALLANYPAAFSTLSVSLVEAGETGGDLPKILARLAKYIGDMIILKKKIQSQLYYPAVVLVFSMALITFMFIFGIPIIQEVYVGMGSQLPAPTRIFLDITGFLNRYIVFIGIALTIVLFLFLNWAKTAPGRMALDGFILKLPVVGSIIRKLLISQFARTLGALYDGGVEVLQSLDIVSRSIGNKVMEKTVKDAEGKIRKGQTITTAFDEGKVFTPMAVSMISVGEETGTLAAMLDELAVFYEAQTEISLKALAELVEPTIMIFVGILIAAIIVILALPFMTLFTVIS